MSFATAIMNPGVVSVVEFGCMLNHGFHVYPELPGKTDGYWLTDFGYACHFHGGLLSDPLNMLIKLSVA